MSDEKTLQGMSEELLDLVDEFKGWNSPEDLAREVLRLRERLKRYEESKHGEQNNA